MPKIPKSSPRLWGLLEQTSYRVGLVAQVLATTKARAIFLFSEAYEFEKESVIELGGLDLPYVQEMEPEQVRFMDE